MMTELNSRIKEECRFFEHIQWLAEHLDLYIASEEGTDILDDLKRYGFNFHTYPQEAMDVYRRFLDNLNNNPYRYMSGIEYVQGKICVCSKSIEGYMIDVDQDLSVPIGFLRALEGIDKRSIEALIINWLNKNLTQYKKNEYKIFSDLLHAGNQKYEKMYADFSAEKNISNISIYLNAVYYAVAAAILIYFFPFYFTHAVTYRIVWGIAALLLLLCFVGVMKGFRSIKRVKCAAKNLANMRDYAERYKNIFSEYFTVDYLAHGNMLVEQMCYPKQYQKIYEIVNDGRLENLKPILPHPKKYYVQLTGMIVILTLIPLGSRHVQSVSTLDMEDNVQEESGQELEAESEPATVPEPEEESKEVGFDENGFVFPDSDVRMLTEAEVYELQNVDGYDFKTMLGFARNEVYARKGYAFKPDGAYYGYYMQYDWYADIPHGDVTENMFNEYERKNVDLIIAIEEREGFR